MEIQKTNRELRQHEWKPLKTGEKFLEAIKSKKVSEAEFDEITQGLRYCMAKIGLRAANFPDKMETIFLIQHIQENFSHLSVDEIKIAFDWGLAGRLDTDMNCYENFSCAYLSRVLNSYWILAKNVKIGNEYIEREDPKKQISSGHISGLLNFKSE